MAKQELTSIQCPGISGRKVSVRVGSKVKIHPTAQFGPDVVLDNEVTIGARCRIGAHSRLTERVTIYAHTTLGNYTRLYFNVTIGAKSSIGERSRLVGCTLEDQVSIGSEAKCHKLFIRRGVQIGRRFTADGSGMRDSATIFSRAIIGDDVTIDGSCLIGDPQSRYPTTIGSNTQIFNTYAAHGQSVIAGQVAIGEMCGLINTRVDTGTIIGANTEIHKAVIGKYVAIGARVTVRPTVVIPDQWQIPDNCIVNPHETAPVVIPKTS